MRAHTHTRTERVAVACVQNAGVVSHHCSSGKRSSSTEICHWAHRQDQIHNWGRRGTLPSTQLPQSGHGVLIRRLMITDLSCLACGLHMGLGLWKSYDAFKITITTCEGSVSLHRHNRTWRTSRQQSKNEVKMSDTPLWLAAVYFLISTTYILETVTLLFSFTRPTNCPSVTPLC